ncbi:MAG: TlpA family protein disulfide reductase [Cyanobacteria bacterium SZAS-4]|nr:TlpA family protein disulfide reductase [Cyanobacteria bacterium SZAS-4]
MKASFKLSLVAILFSAAAVASAAAHVSAAQTESPGYPPYVTDKKLHATSDLRGKKAPKMHVAKWLTGHAPRTKGKVVLMDFWATWCPDCHRLIPELNKFKQKFGDDLVIIGITDEQESVVKKFLETHPIESNIALAPDKKMYNYVGVKGIPQVLVISADGIVRFQGYADSKEDPLTEDKLAQIINTSKAHH